MFMRLLDTLLPATVLVAMVLAMAAAFGALQPAQPHASAPRKVQLERVVVTAERVPAALAQAQASAAATAVR